MRFLLIFIVGVLLLTSCSSGKKAYEQGDYYTAVIKSVNRLRQNPNHKKSKEALKHAYPLAISTLESDAKRILASPNPLKSKDALRVYQQLNILHDEIRRAPGALKVVPSPISYNSRINVLKPLAAQEAYDEAEKLMERQTREAAKEAYYLFREANEIMPGYQDVEDKIEQAHFEATLKVIVEQIPVPTQYTLSSNFFRDKVEEYLHTQFRNNAFVRFYTPEEAKKTNLPYVDHYLQIAFDDFMVGNTHLLEKEELAKRDSVKIGEVELENGTKKPVYGSVNAKVSRFKKQVISKGLLSMQIRDAETNAVLSHKKFDGEFIWLNEWGSFNGDERALSAEHKELVKKREVSPPPPQDLFIEFTRPIYSQLTQALESFYARY